MSTDTPARRDLRIDDLELLATAARDADQPLQICRALERVSAETIGHRLFTVMLFDSARSEVQRVYSTLPSVYPIGGRKKKADTTWAHHVLEEMRVFRGTTDADIRAAFDDSETILGLGLGSVLNVPVVLAGRCLGTMNLLHGAGWYRPDDERTGRVLAAFLAPALLAGHC
jgi:hypothetical protein